MIVANGRLGNCRVAAMDFALGRLSVLGLDTGAKMLPWIRFFRLEK